MVKIPRIPIMELFGPTIQGEGLMTGTVTHFLRTGGCGLRCAWCDSLHAVLPNLIRSGRTMMTIGEIYDAIDARPFAPYVTLTGGDPCIHKGLGEMIIGFNARGMKVAVETQGEIFADWLPVCDVITFSPKPPSSGNIVDYKELTRYLVDTFNIGRRAYPVQICIKIVCFSAEDFTYAMDVYNYMPSPLYDAFYFTSGTPMFSEPLHIQDALPTEEIAIRANLKLQGTLKGMHRLATTMLAQTKKTPFNEKVHLGCQQHVLLWPDKLTGV